MSGRAGAARLTIAIVLQQAVIPAVALHAQQLARVTPSISTTQLYDSNLFATSDRRQGDFVARISPALDTEVVAPLWTLSGRYAFDLERYASHPDLTTANARQRGTFGLTYRPTPRLTATAGAEVWNTQTPGELNEASGLTFTRARARRLAAHSSLARKFSPVTSATLDYSFTEDRLGSMFSVRTHASGFEAERAVSSRDTVSARYRVQVFSFASDAAVDQHVTSHAAGVGWTRAISRRVHVSIAGGPRVTGSSFAPEWSVSAAYRAQRGDLSLVYGRTQTTVIGVAGAADTQNILAIGSWTFGRSLKVQIAPGAMRNTLGPLRADVYRIGIDVSQQVASNLALDVALDSSLQHGTLYAAGPHGRIPRHAVFVSLVAASAGRQR